MSAMLNEGKKLFKDPVYEEGILVTKLAQDIINTREFQRLRYIKQLGACYFVFHCATTSRFEHSIGVYHLTGLILNSLRSRGFTYFDMLISRQDWDGNPIFERVELDDFHIEVIKIAGLLHDVGHGPFSHLFDKLIKDYKKTDIVKTKHEDRSKLLIEKLLKENTNFTDEIISFIKDLIVPPVHVKHLPIYQIVANEANGIDSDKLDYLIRDWMQIYSGKPFDVKLIMSGMLVMDNKITFSDSIDTEILKIFTTRHFMHKNVYRNKTVEVIDCMLADIFNEIDIFIKFIEKSADMDQFCKLVDYDFFNILEKDNISLIPEQFYENFKRAKIIYDRILKRNLYKAIYCHQERPITKETYEKYHIKNEKLIIKKTFDIGFVSPGEPNPFDNIYFFPAEKPEFEIYQKKPNEINPLSSDKYMETLTLYIIKDIDLANNIEMLILSEQP